MECRVVPLDRLEASRQSSGPGYHLWKVLDPVSKSGLYILRVLTLGVFPVDINSFRKSQQNHPVRRYESTYRQVRCPGPAE